MSGLLAWVAGSGVVQGVIMGLTFAFLTTVPVLNAVAKRETTTVNGWRAIRRAGRPDNGPLLRAALQKALPVVNVFEEAAYWTAATDATGTPLHGRHAYRLRFEAGGLPPHHAFWSLTATDPGGYLVSEPTGPSNVSSHGELAASADGAVEILLQSHRPSDAAANWLAVPPGRFALMLRVYLPGAAIVDGDYRVPPIVEV
ncbi:MAG: DUF1214 domain-containing protein [Micropruina sp.]|uniref:DUF1214 domain-containing protein n=1 Tax=Micropruina sp. TaxID=2737536 RepID=UPI0039E70F2F